MNLLKNAFSLERVINFEVSQASIFVYFLYFLYIFCIFSELHFRTQFGTSKMEVLGPKMEVLGPPKSIKIKVKNYIKKWHEKMTKK